MVLRIVELLELMLGVDLCLWAKLGSPSILLLVNRYRTYSFLNLDHDLVDVKGLFVSVHRVRVLILMPPFDSPLSTVSINLRNACATVR